jgi:ATP-dependent DNA helicase RecG
MTRTRPAGRPAGNGPGTPPGRRPAARADAPDPGDGLDAPLARSGLPGAAALGRHGPRLGMRTVRDLLTHLPRRYEDLRELSTVAQVERMADGEVATVRARVADLRVERTFRRRVQRTVALLRDETGEIEATWFGRRYIERRLAQGDALVASGRVRRRGWRVALDDPEFQRDDGSEMLHAGRIVPVYPLTAGLTTRVLRSAIRAALDRFGPYAEYLPDDLRDGLPAIGEAIEQAHYPTDFERRDAALLRIAHDELLALQVGMVARRRQRLADAGRPIVLDDALEVRLAAALAAGLARRLGREAALTDDQARAMAAIREDVSGSRPMLRLIQGDVGSGKTVIAAYALGLAALAGGQGAILAPTDLLARQHASTLADLLDGCGLPVTLLTGSLSAAGRRAALEGIANGQAQIVVGTHALLGEHVDFAALDLVVIDEQHRFGVSQREALASKGRTPHVLLMTATPIPRTLGQVLYADLDVSDVRSAPSGRPGVRTGIRRSDALAGTWERVREEAAAGHRTFVVAPLISPDDAAVEGPGDGAAPSDPAAPPARAAMEVHAELARDLAPLRVGLVHGRMRPAERDAEMARFRDGDTDVLVGTTVVEVGVDVPEATMMVVLSADRFGLSQLHQLRGRVGRGSAESFCVLVADVEPESIAGQRLDAVRTTQDGFELAEQDFELRREGDVLGLSQSGLPRLKAASLVRPEHRELATRCRAAAERVLDAGGRLPGALGALRRELEAGWLSQVAAGEAEAEEGIGA